MIVDIKARRAPVQADAMDIIGLNTAWLPAPSSKDLSPLLRKDKLWGVSRGFMYGRLAQLTNCIVAAIFYCQASVENMASKNTGITKNVA